MMSISFFHASCCGQCKAKTLLTSSGKKSVRINDRNHIETTFAVMPSEYSQERNHTHPRHVIDLWFLCFCYVSSTILLSINTIFRHSNEIYVLIFHFSPMRMFLIFIPSIFYETLLSLPVVAAKIGFSTIQYSDSSDVECLKGDFLYKFNSSFSTTDFKLFLSMRKKKKIETSKKSPPKKLKPKKKISLRQTTVWATRIGRVLTMWMFVVVLCGLITRKSKRNGRLSSDATNDA